MENKQIKLLKKTANDIRIEIIEMLYKIGVEYKGHPGPALSIVEIITCLYFNILNINPAEPGWKDRDRVILSKGHACPVLYAALAMKGYFNKSHLYTLRHIGSILQGHPDMKKTPGIDMTTGSLGHGLAAGVGMALAARLDKRGFKTFVILGDGEMQEGLVWEAVMAAGHQKLNNLIAIVDRNCWQSCDCVDLTMNIEPLKDKFLSFNWDVKEIDGHNIEDIIFALKESNNCIKPLCIIAKTVKGKGISFMENNNSWHQKGVSEEDYLNSMKELRRVGELI